MAIFSEDVTYQGQEFTNLFQSIFPDAEIKYEDGEIIGIAPVFGRNVVAKWIAGMNRKKAGDPKQEKNCYVVIDFFHLDNKGTEDNPDYVGNISQSGMISGSIEFMKLIIRFVKCLKKLGIQILFDAVGDSRALSYSTILQKVGVLVLNKCGLHIL
jgi:hypothetical protein